MIKGLNKEVVVINDTGSDCFEFAVFFVKPDSAATRKDMVAEAECLVAARNPAAKRCGLPAKAALFLAASGGSAATLIASLIINSLR